MPSLLALRGPLIGTRIALPAGSLSIGRHDRSAIVLPDPSVSSERCVVVWTGGKVKLRDLDPANPTFVNGLPATNAPLQDGDQIQIGESLFLLQLADAGTPSGEIVRVEERPALERSTLVLRREDVYVDHAAARTASPERLSRDLAALVRLSAAINAVSGLVALERPLFELIADAVPADRGVLVRTLEKSREIGSAVGWSRRGTPAVFPLSRPVIDRVLGEMVGVLSREPLPGAESSGLSRFTLAAPLVALNNPLGVLVLETDNPSGFDEGHLRLLIAVAGITATALEHARHTESLELENRRLHAELHVNHNMVGESAGMRALYRRIARVAPTDSTVLITGESGTGKELVARAIHRNSGRADDPFVAINCAAITETLLESELFGHERGAFTGAVVQKKGKLETAEGGTVFLDEIGELSPALQAKLLRVIQEREFERVGGTKRLAVNFRLVAATNRDLEAAIAQGSFRRDLYYRLNVVTLTTVPLRERRADVPLLARYFLRRHGERAKRRVSELSPDALACLMAYDWPGNVRELDNAIEHAVVLGSTPTILADDLPEAVAESASAGSAPAPWPSRFHDAIKRAKTELIIRAVHQSAGNYNAAARLLGLHPNYLHRLIRNLQIKAELKSLADSHTPSRG